MRSWSPTLVANLESEEATRCFMIEANNGITPVVRLTDIDKDLTVGLNTFLKSPGFNVSKWTVASGGRPSTIDFTLAIDAAGPIYADHVKRGAWRGALITIWIGNFNNPSDREILVSGFVGLTQSTDRLAGKMQSITKANALSDIILLTVQPKCSFKFGSSQCGVNLGPLTLSATVATVTSTSKFTITVTNPSGFDFTHGGITFTSGANSGAKQWVRRWVSGTSLVELVNGVPFDIQVGDTLTIHAGCDLSRTGAHGCKHYNNNNRFPGFDKTPGELLGGT
ncbi:DUF2163 domain-containing protein [Mesorhizobium sp. M2D.F.Ca.ET.145.01.1.1]|uniref:DUF2163 domain-containing protein n=1 Tax=unclassified Mesorhizobium TaxID=325217 RepID=UPI000FCCA2D6|nr:MULTISPECIES: DUF2163 domain-containing protein [unclassified Mesorhizobium]TGU44628.1 DUF2163 domain-containing protein [bacterium M00.F.Ca.ET.146.01.1.1]TGU58456.1 DUF2163 domain-containing protein [Mesorhizobium sp. M2D.F.Ca.ET.148.01.1.1]TGU64388.1 DUF2163 domain-containing protein [Mesorhizobium sp. M2D.F.Ca.ET.147.01.1.1]TGW09964.1 DUF2163 domain-containing protein [Mesorhizobium sp. M2D.F.Ca.ET.145.01.1.1]